MSGVECAMIIVMKMFRQFTALVFETIGLSTPRGRVMFFVLLSCVIFLMPVRWPVPFSIWQHLGVKSPSIGLTRAYRHLLRGDFVAAWQQNKLIYAVIIVGGVVIGKDVYAIYRSQVYENIPKRFHAKP